MMWDEESAQRLGATIRRLRLERGLSQESMAHQAGITKNQVQLIEAGRASGKQGSTGPSNPQMATLRGLASVLELTVAQLMVEAEL